MTSSSQSTQSNSIYPITLSNSCMLQALSNNTESPFPPTTVTNTCSPAAAESEAARRERVTMILTSAIALIDGNDFHPIDRSAMHSSWPLHQ
jgi:hypothetical protein